MKKIKLLLALASALVVTSALADVVVTSLQVTNTVSPTISIVNWPTNTPFGTTNLSTGKYIDTASYDTLAVVVKASLTSSNATQGLTFALVRAGINGTPVGNDFETTPSLTITAPFISGTNANWVWTTNIVDRYWGSASTHIGIYSLTNSAIPGGLNNVSNLTISVIRKSAAVVVR